MTNPKREGNFTEARARKVINEIAERSGMGAIEFATNNSFLNEWIRGKETTKAKGTTIRYRHTVDSFLKFLGKRASANLANIRPADIAAFRDEQVKEGKSQGTANMVVKTLRIPFNVARRQGLILTNPAEAVDLFAVGQQSRDTFTREQLMDLLKVANQEWRGMILLGACHGLRLGDAARFRVLSDTSRNRTFPSAFRALGRRSPLPAPFDLHLLCGETQVHRFNLPRTAPAQK